MFTRIKEWISYKSVYNFLENFFIIYSFRNDLTNIINKFVHVFFFKSVNPNSWLINMTLNFIKIFINIY